MKSQIIASMSSFILGTGATLVALSSWLGTSDLQEIKQAVQGYMAEVEQHSLALAQDYQVTVENANAEIGEYKVALEQANDNISQLITAYEQQEFEHEIELKGQQAQAEQDLADLQQAYDEMVARIESDYESNMNEVIEQANAEINQANIEVAETKEQVLADLQTSQVDEYVEQAKQLKDQLDTGNDKSVTDISEIVGEEEQVQE